jgi:hypothetical protein
MRRIVCALMTVVACAAPLRGQGLRDQVRNLFRFGNCGELVCLFLSPGNHGTHFNPDADTSGTELINFLSDAIVVSVDNIPVGATSSGTTFQIGPNGTPIATSGSSGPIFGERSQTLGRGRFLIGVGVTGNQYESIRGVKLSDINLTLTHRDNFPPGLGDPSFEYDTLHIHTSMKVALTAYSLRMSYGLSNRIDVGVVVPVLDLSMSGTSIGTVFNTENPPEVPPPHYFKQIGSTFQVTDTAHASGTATGIGDIAARVKVNLYQTRQEGVALLGEVRLPTGDNANLLGAGSAAFTAMAIASATYGPVSPHVNGGYVYRASKSQNSAALTTIGADASLSQRITLAADLIGQWQVGPNYLILPKPAHYIDGSVVRRTTIPSIPDNFVDGSFGAKALIAAQFTVVGNVIVPFTDAGMRSNLVWSVGLEKSF